MRTIWKEVVEIDNIQQITLPIGSEVLTVQTQTGVPCIWFLVPDSKAEYKTRTFIVYGTGHEVKPYEMKYIGTFQTSNGTYVWHLFEVCLLSTNIGMEGIFCPLDCLLFGKFTV